MITKSNLKKILELWISPLLVGCLLASGYSISKRILNANSLANSRKNLSKSTKLDFTTPTSNEKKYPKVTLRTPTNPENRITTPLQETKSPPGKPPEKALRLPAKDPLQKKSIPKKTEKFLQDQNIDLLFQRLPSPF